MSVTDDNEERGIIIVSNCKLNGNNGTDVNGCYTDIIEFFNSAEKDSAIQKFKKLEYK